MLRLAVRFGGELLGVLQRAHARVVPALENGVDVFHVTLPVLHPHGGCTLVQARRACPLEYPTVRVLTLVPAARARYRRRVRNASRGGLIRARTVSPPAASMLKI